MVGRWKTVFLASLLAAGVAGSIPANSKLSTTQVLKALERTSSSTWRPSWNTARKQTLGAAGDADLAIAVDLMGPVSQEALEHRFDWTVGAVDRDAVHLLADPRDPVEKLFFGKLDLAVSRQSGLIETVSFVDRLRGHSTSAVEEDASGIRLVSEIQLAGDDDGQPADSAPEVNNILAAWQNGTSAIRNINLTFERYRYDRAFHLEARAVGRFVFLAPNIGMYRIQPAPIPVGTESRVLGSDGQRFTLRTDSAQSYVWDAGTVTIADDLHRTFQQLALPKQDASIQRVVGSWDNVWAAIAEPQVALPCVVDVDPRELKEQFHLSVLRNDDQQIVLRCLPRTAQSKRQLSEMLVIIDAQTHLTKATKFVGASGDQELVHVFLYEQINQPELEQRSWAPDLKNYRTIEMPPLAPPAE
jgi:hypothetical protein